MKFPVDQPYKITTPFSSAHPGLDIAPIPAGSTGRNCYAPERSTVIASSFVESLEGNYVMLRGFDTGKYYYFGHFAERKVSLGQNISEGAVIGILGMTGQADGIHTHCEVRTSTNSGRIDPAQFFKDNIKGGSSNVSKITLNQLRLLAYSFTGFNGLDGAPNALNGDRDADLNKYVGMDSGEAIDKFWNSDERIRYTDKIIPGIVWQRQDYKSKLEKLQETIKAQYEPITETLYKKKEN